jgi:hypothetical protein
MIGNFHGEPSETWEGPYFRLHTDHINRHNTMILYENRRKYCLEQSRTEGNF